MLELVSSRVLTLFAFAGTKQEKQNRRVQLISLMTFICFLLPWVLSQSSHVRKFLLLLHYVMSIFILWQTVLTVEVCRALPVILRPKTSGGVSSIVTSGSAHIVPQLLGKKASI